MSDLRKAAEMALGAFETYLQFSTEEMLFHRIAKARAEALRQALSKEFNPDWNQVEALQESLREHMAEIQRLRQALAQPKQECTCSAKDMPFGRCCKALPKQQPVKWINFNAATGQESIDDYCDSELASIPLYTAPPKREWVGLTDEEMHFCAQAMDAEPLAEGWSELIKFAKAIEAKLKEKNT